MAMTVNFEFEDRMLPYVFFGKNVDKRSRYKLKGVHVYAYTPTPVIITLKEGRQGQGRIRDLLPDAPETPFVETFAIECQDRLVLKAFRESDPLQKLVRTIFNDNVKALRVMEDVVTIEFQRPLAGRARGKKTRLKAENPADLEWIKDLKSKVLKLSKIVTMVEEGKLEPRPQTKKVSPAASGKTLAVLVALTLLAAAGWFIYGTGTF